MATALAARPTTATLEKQVAEAEAARGQAQKSLREAETRVNELAKPLMSAGIDLPTYSVEDRLDAQLNLPTVRHELVTRQREALKADARANAARAALRDAIAAETHQRRRAVVGRLAKLLLEARVEADGLAALEDVSPSGDAILWPTLQTSTSLFTSQLDAWLASIKANDLL